MVRQRRTLSSAGHHSRLASAGRIAGAWSPFPPRQRRVRARLVSRLCHGASVSLLVAPLAAAVALLLAISLGIAAGYHGGWVDTFVVKASEVFIVLPWFYVVVALRAALPLTISGPAGLVIVFAVLAALDPRRRPGFFEGSCNRRRIASSSLPVARRAPGRQGCFDITCCRSWCRPCERSFCSAFPRTSLRR